MKTFTKVGPDDFLLCLVCFSYGQYKDYEYREGYGYLCKECIEVVDEGKDQETGP